MSGILHQLTALAISGSIAPPLLLLTNLFFGSRRSLPNATDLALGYFVSSAAMAIVGLTFFGRAGEGGVASMIGRGVNATVIGRLLVVGLRSLLKAPDLDAQPPRGMESISLIAPVVWMEKTNRAITVVLFFVFGAFFLMRGLSG